MRRLLLVTMASAGCGGGDSGGDASGTGESTATEASSMGDETAATTLGGGPCDEGQCAGNIVVAIDGGPTLSDMGYERTACLLVEQGGQVIELQRQASCDLASVALVATFRVPERIDAPGSYELGLAEVSAAWTVENADPSVTGVYLAAGDVSLIVSELELGSGGRIAGVLVASVDGISPLRTTGVASVMFDVALP